MGTEQVLVVLLLYHYVLYVHDIVRDDGCRAHSKYSDRFDCHVLLPKLLEPILRFSPPKDSKYTLLKILLKAENENEENGNNYKPFPIVL